MKKKDMKINEEENNSQENNLQDETRSPAVESQESSDISSEVQQGDMETSQDITQARVTQEKTPVEETPQERNFRALREKAERAERERDALIGQLKAIESKKEEIDYSVAPDDLVEGKHLGKYDKKIKEIENRLIENQLKTQFPDFDKVVNADNIRMLSENNPAIAQTLQANTDLYSQAVTAYTLIKNLGIYQEDTYSSNRATVERNNTKPRPLTSISPQQGEGPLSKANAFAEGLTDELKTQLWKEIQEARKKG